MHALMAITKKLQVPIDVMFNLFDSFVLSILNYSCEVWGFYTAENIERAHRKFCKWLINVKMSTNNLSLAGEFGRFPLFIGRHVRIIKYWLNLYQSKNDNCILRSITDISRTEVENGKINNSWTAKVKDLLQRNGFYDVWMFPESVNINVFIPQLHTRLKDNFILVWRQGLNLSTSLLLYKELNHNFEMSPYLTILVNKNSVTH